MTEHTPSKDKSTGRIHRKASDWRQLVSDFETSDLTIAEFCAENGIAQSGFYHWRKKFRDTDSANDKPLTQASFIELPLQSSVKPTASLHQWDIELEIGAGTVLRIRRA